MARAVALSVETPAMGALRAPVVREEPAAWEAVAVEVVVVVAEAAEVVVMVAAVEDAVNKIIQLETPNLNTIQHYENFQIFDSNDPHLHFLQPGLAGSTPCGKRNCR